VLSKKKNPLLLISRLRVDESHSKLASRSWASFEYKKMTFFCKCKFSKYGICKNASLTFAKLSKLALNFFLILAKWHQRMPFV
jgi:hypothetical protein